MTVKKNKIIKVLKNTFMNNTPLHRVLIILGWILIISGVLIYNTFDFRLTELFPTCLFLKVTGYYCAGCGGTRAVQHLLKGDIIGSIRYNFIPFTVSAFFLAMFFQYTVNAFFKTRIRIIAFKEWMLWLSLAAVVSFWIIRNIV